MKIVMYSNFFPPNAIGGAEIYVYRLASALQSKGHTLKILTNEDTDYTINGLHVIGVRKFFFALFNFYFFYKELKGYDIFHIHNIHSPIYLFIIILAAKINKIPIVWTAHDYWFMCQNNLLLDKSNEICSPNRCENCYSNILFREGIHTLQKIKRIVKKVDVAIAPSHIMKEKMIHFGFDRNNVKQIAYGLPIEKYPYSIANSKSKIVLFIGSLGYHKGCKFLIEAIPVVLEEHLDTKLLIVGEGSEKNKLQLLVKRLGIENHVEFLGIIPNEKTHELYKYSNIVVVPSIWQEVLGIVGLEAMAIGRPTIGSNIGGIPDWIENGKTGYLVETKSSEQIADRIKQILSDYDGAIRMGINARKKIERDFNMIKHVSIIEDLYSEVLE